MVGQLPRPAADRPIRSGNVASLDADVAPGRAALVAPAGLFRDALAHLIAAQLGIAIECHVRAADAPSGPVQLALIVVDPAGFSREALRDEVATLRARCDGAAIGLVIPDERAATAAGLAAHGVAGVVSLSAGAEIAVASVRLMLLGGYCLPPEPAASGPNEPEWTASDLAASAPQEIQVADERPELGDRLTARERDVLLSLREGNQNKIIAFKLGISESTVKVHLRNLMKKLKASNRTQAALGGSPRMATVRSEAVEARRLGGAGTIFAK